MEKGSKTHVWRDIVSSVQFVAAHRDAKYWEIDDWCSGEENGWPRFDRVRKRKCKNAVRTIETMDEMLDPSASNRADERFTSEDRLHF